MSNATITIVGTRFVYHRREANNAYLGLSMQHDTLLQIYGRFNVDFDKLANAGLRSESTQEKYTTVYKHLKEFIRYRYNLSDIGLKDITPAFITDFEIFLRAEKMCSHNTIVLYMISLRKMITSAQKNRFPTNGMPIETRSKMLVHREP